MGSPITFSGFNQIDFGVILNAIMAQERVPLTRLETQKATLDTQNSQFGTLATRLAALERALEALRGTDSMGVLTASSSDSGVGVSTTGDTVAGTYDVVVTELARAQVLTSASTYTSLSDVVATGGTLTLTSDTGSAVTVTLSGPTTLQELAALINAEPAAPASASVVQTASGVYRLVLTAKATGTTNTFTISHTLTGGSGLTHTDTNGDGVSGDSAADNTQNASDASFTVNNLWITSAGNTITGVIPGVTLILKKKDPTTTVTVTVGRDGNAVAEKIERLVSAYNELASFAKEQSATALAGKPSIGRDPLLRGLLDTIRRTLQREYTVGDTFTRLAQVGVGFDSSGKLTFDRARFDEAMATAPADVQALFSGTDGSGGVIGTLKAVVEPYTQAGGLLASARERLGEQVSSLVRRLDEMEARLALRRATLQRELWAADRAMSQLNGQRSALEALGAQYRLF